MFARKSKLFLQLAVDVADEEKNFFPSFCPWMRDEGTRN